MNKTSYLLPIKDNDSMLEKELNEIKEKKGELLIIDYGSKDSTMNILTKFEGKHKNNELDIKLYFLKTTKLKAILYLLNFKKYDKIKVLNINNHNIFNLFFSNILGLFILFVNIILNNFKKSKNVNHNIKHNIKHMGVILDGNRRFQKKNNFMKDIQHSIGYIKTLEIIEYIKKKNIEHITFYCFSTENWKRDEDEIDNIFKLLYILHDKYKIDKNIPNSLLYDVKINILSTNEKKFSKKTLETINSIHNISRTSCNNNYNINMCFNYGGREEIINTSKKLVEKGLEINEENFTKNLLTGECPELDIMIRFGNEKRISNFLLYQLAYTELFFINKLLPEVSINDINEILLEYNNRNIRKGK